MQQQQHEKTHFQSSIAYPSCVNMTKGTSMNHGLVNLVSMSLLMKDSDDLFASSGISTSRQNQTRNTVSILDELLTEDLLTPFPAPSAAASSSENVVSFDSIFDDDDDALEPTPLSQQFSITEGTRPAPLMLQASSAPTDNGALDRLIAQEFHQVTPSSTPSELQRKRTLESTVRETVVPEAAVSSKSNNKRQRLDDDESQIPRFRDYQETGWIDQFKELAEFQKINGHCLVPHTYEQNPILARWVKRQRYQYKLKKEGKKSTMTDTRIEMLESIGFVWDSHAVAWEERLQELKEFQAEFGHCIVPSNYQKSASLSTWVKCQRRQNKLFWNGEKSTMTQERFNALCELGFTWELRRSKKSMKA